MAKKKRTQSIAVLEAERLDRAIEQFGIPLDREMTDAEFDRIVVQTASFPWAFKVADRHEQRRKERCNRR